VIAIDIAGRPIGRILIAEGVAPLRAGTVGDLLGLGLSVIGMASMLYGARQLAARLAEHRLPSAHATLQQWEKTVMMEVLQLAILVCAGLVLLAVLQPFLQIREGIALVLLLISAIVVVIWRGARHVAPAAH